MEALWNHMQLERPPNARCCIKRKKFDATTFRMVLEKAIKDLNSQELLHKEAAILSRLIYRMKRKFRNDKGVKAMSKINRALLNYLSLSLEKEYENLKSYIEVDDKYVTLPSKQMVEYVLVRTQGFAKLLIRVEEVSKHSAHFLKSRITMGHAWSVALIAYAVVSRIWILTRHLVKRSCTWYNDLYQYLTLFNTSGLNWLPKDYEMTSNLEEWLALPWIQQPTPSIPSSYGLRTTMFKLIIPHEYDSDEDLALDNDYGKNTEHGNISLYTQEESIVPSIATKNKNEDGLFNNDTREIIDPYTFNLISTTKKGIFAKDSCTNLPVVTKEKEHKITRTQDNNKEIYFQNIEDEGISIKREKNVTVKLKKLTKKKDSQKLLTLNNVKNKAQLKLLLSSESYPGVDKLRWNMIKNKCKKLQNKLDASSDETNQSILFKKVIKRIQRWIT